MNFYSPAFLFAFLPLMAAAYHLLRKARWQNALLIAAGLLFYAFGDIRHLPLLLFSCALHYGAGRALMAAKRARGAILAACASVDLLILAFYKTRGALPLGISFYTFQAISYAADTYRDPNCGTKSVRELLQYLTFFPQLTAGPLMRFSAVRPYLSERSTGWTQSAAGIRRFVCGLCKKLLLSGAAAGVVNAMFSLERVDAIGAWAGAVCYCLQLYFDFSGYSDMALGLGMLFGIALPENFRYPYLAGSVSEFWRRWHMTLSGWFRDYLYIPLGGSRKGTVRTVRNKMIVFLATGLWHGTGWTFVLWGLWHGLWCSVETVLDREKKLTRHWYGHVYTLLVVVLGFAVFRSESLAQAGMLLRAMLTGFGRVDACRLALRNVMTWRTSALCLAGLLACFPVWPKIKRRFDGRAGTAALDVLTLAGLIVCMMQLAANSFQPFIYAGF